MPRQREMPKFWQDFNQTTGHLFAQLSRWRLIENDSCRDIFRVGIVIMRSLVCKARGGSAGKKNWERNPVLLLCNSIFVVNGEIQFQNIARLNTLDISMEFRNDIYSTENFNYVSIWVSPVNILFRNFLDFTNKVLDHVWWYEAVFVNSKASMNYVWYCDVLVMVWS